MKKQVLSLAFLLASACAYSQTSYLSELVINNRQVEKTADRQVRVSFDVDLSELDMKRQQSLRVIPVIVSEDGSQEAELPAFVINGTVRDKVNARQVALGNAGAGEDALVTVRRKNGTSQSVNYETSVPFKRWMIGGNLQLRSYATGCAQCNEGNETNYTGDILPPMNPQYGSPFVQPKEEEVKRRSETRTARLQFRQGSAVIQKNYQENAKELDAVHRSMQLVKDNDDLTITGIYVTGYASPEGSFKSNMTLSERRAKALVEHFRRANKWDRKLFTTDWKGEDWEGLQRAVEASSLDTKDQVLAVISDEENPDARDAKLRAIDGGKTYNTLLNDFYPPLRRSFCVVDFTVRPYTLEEAKRIINENPKLLSLKEMYGVAKSYPEGSNEYNEAFLTAQRLYPNDADAATNAAAVWIAQGKIAEAKAALQQVEQTAGVCNALGIVYAKEKDYARAEEMFTKAASQGNTEAKANLEALKKYIKDYNENNY